MKSVTSNRRLLIVFIVIAAIIILTAANMIRHSNDASSTINSFEACAAAGNPVMATYPEQCNANGQTFVNPDQKAQ